MKRTLDVHPLEVYLFCLSEVRERAGWLGHTLNLFRITWRNCDARRCFIFYSSPIEFELNLTRVSLRQSPATLLYLDFLSLRLALLATFRGTNPIRFSSFSPNQCNLDLFEAAKRSPLFCSILARLHGQIATLSSHSPRLVEHLVSPLVCAVVLCLTQCQPSIDILISS